jgi:hypothetical protein
VAAASGSPVDGAEMHAGDAVALVLMRGDLNLAAHGTISDRWGDEVVAFAHPIYSLGPIRLPMAHSEVVTTISSVASSFKLSNAGPLIGVFDQDREAGTHGVLGAVPEMTPLNVRLRGLVERDYHMDMADAPLFRPTLIAIGTMGALNSGSWATGFQGFDLEATFHLAGREDLTIAQSFDGPNAATDAAIHLLVFAAFLELNEMGEVGLEGIDIEIEQAERPRTTTLTAVHAEHTRVHPGERLGLWLELQPFRGERERQRLEVTIPADLEDGKYYLMVGDGTSIDAARMAVEKSEAQTLDQSLDLIRSLHPRDQLHVLGLAAAPGVAVAGESLPDLPGSVRSLYAGAKVGDALRLRIVDHQVEDAGRPLDGIHRVDLEVRRPPI